MHASPLALSLAAPRHAAGLARERRGSRRYLAGWCSARTLHLLAPHRLERRASAVPDSRDMLMLTPATLYAQLVIAANNRRLPPPLRPRHARWAWLVWGAAAHFSGQTVFARPAIARRLREDPAPRFPPALRDAGAARRHGLRPARARARHRRRDQPRLHATRGLAGARARARLRRPQPDPQRRASGARTSPARGAVAPRSRRPLSRRRRSRPCASPSPPPACRARCEGSPGRPRRR